jgi:type VI secretion system protein ImpM
VTGSFASLAPDATLSELAAGTGWYGKLPAIGDFASRRVNDQFVRTWDDWLQRAVTASKSALQEGWLDVYLSSPIWNFAIFPNVLDSDIAYAGCLMSSADRVGRYFPLTTCVEVPYPQLLADELMNGAHWFRKLSEIMVSALSPDTSLEQFDSHLAGHALNTESLALGADYGLAPALSSAARNSGPSGGLASDLSHLLPATQRAFLLQALNGKSLWWTNVHNGASASGTSAIYWVQQGMLPPAHYTQLISGTLPDS